MIDTNDCIEWDRALAPTGYGVTGRKNGASQYVHRLAYEEVHGPIPEGLQIDHLCSNRACINVDHLEAVTPAENARRSGNTLKTHCSQGHPFSGENLIISYYKGKRRRICRACRRSR